MTLASSFRYDKDKTDAEVATIEAAMLREAIEKKQLDHDHVLYILGTRSIYQLRETFVAYKKNYGITIDKVQDIHGLVSWILFSSPEIFIIRCFVVCTGC